MSPIDKTYILDEKNRKVAVQLDIATFDKIEELLEDYALGQYVKEEQNVESLSVAEAKAFYKSLPKKE